VKLIRIRIRGSVAWYPCPDPALFFGGFQNVIKNEGFSLNFCLLITYVVTFTSVFKDNKLKRSHKIVETKVLNVFAC
jgi:hypothetical protein